MSSEKRTRAEGMGAIPHDEGTTFRVWAPHASRVAVIGTFNEWDASRDELVEEGDGYWAVDVPEAHPGDEYKFHIENGDTVLQRRDPYARAITDSALNGLIMANDFEWGEAAEFRTPAWDDLVIYEMHVGTFHTDGNDGDGGFASAAEKLPYLRSLGITAIEIMPPMDFPGSRSWGYNPSQPFAVEQTYGGPNGLKSFVRAAHEHGIAVILDIVFNHFGPDDLDLWRFDGWHENGWGGIYFYNDRRAETPWGDTRPDYGRPEVRQYLRDNALMWLDEYQIDGLRWDATAYIRNIHGENNDPDNDLPDGWSLMQWINDEIGSRESGFLSIAEDMAENEWIVTGTEQGGAGFGSQWSAHFAHVVREMLAAEDDANRDLVAVADLLAAPPVGDALRRVIYTESHDEVANGQARLPEEISPEDSFDWFARKRSTLGAALIMTTPGIPMLFQGQEFMEDRWFSDSDPLDWSQKESFEGIVQLYRDLIRLRRNLDGVSRGLQGQNVEVYHVNQDANVILFQRWAEGGPGDTVVVGMNFANRPVTGYLVGLPAGGPWFVRFDSHAAAYDESYSDQVTTDVEAVEESADGYPFSARIGIAPYSAVLFSQDGS